MGIENKTPDIRVGYPGTTVSGDVGAVTGRSNGGDARARVGNIENVPCSHAAALPPIARLLSGRNRIPSVPFV